MSITQTLKLTVIIRDEAPMRHLNEPVALRSVTVPLSSEQLDLIAIRDADEAISQCFLEQDNDV